LHLQTALAGLGRQPEVNIVLAGFGDLLLVERQHLPGHLRWLPQRLMQLLDPPHEFTGLPFRRGQNQHQGRRF